MKDYSPELFPYAYNILGSAQDAKDAVQDVLYKFLASPREEIENEKNYLIRAVINQAINIKNRKKKVLSGDVWLPEPVATEEADKDLHLSDIVSYSLMVLMERLNPKERAVFILKEGFGYSHEEIAGLLSGTVEGSRKLLSRAKTKLDTARPDGPGPVVSPVTAPSLQRHPDPFHTELLEKFIGAIRGGDVKTLEGLLTEDIQYFADGGGKIKVVSKSTIGQKDVASLLLFVYERFQQNASLVATMVNHQPAFLYYLKGRIFICQVFDIRPDGRIAQINTVIDPDKLKRFGGHE